MSKVKTALGGLSDVDGVIGSFVVTDSGSLLGTTLPAAFDADVFADAGPRLARLVEASAALAEGFKGIVLKFPEHRLFVKEVSGTLLGVVLTSAASLPALRVATNLVGRKLSVLVAEAPLAAPAEDAAPITDRSPAPAAPVASQPPAAAPRGTPPPPSVAPTSRQMYYRGRPVGGR